MNKPIRLGSEVAANQHFPNINNNSEYYNITVCYYILKQYAVKQLRAPTKPNKIIVS